MTSTPALTSNHTVWCTLVALLLCAFSTSATAQEGNAPVYVEPTERQIELNEEAVRALASGDGVKAVSLLQESNYLGELNVTYLNLGRAYQQLDNCKEARKAYEKVFEAPVVETPPPGFIESKARSFLGELGQTCDEDERASAEDMEEEETPGEEEIGAPDQADESGAVAAEETVIPGEEVETTAETTATRNNTTSIILLGSGAALVGAGVGLHFAAEGVRDPLRDPETNTDGNVSEMSQQEALDTERRANNLEIAAISAGVAGLAVAGIGAVLLLSGGESEADAQTTFLMSPTRHGWAIGIQRRF